MWARGCKNRACCVSGPEVVKGVPNQCAVVLLAMAVFCFCLVFRVYVLFCFLVFGCQYQCNQLPGKTRLRNDLLCVEWDVKPYTFTIYTHDVLAKNDSMSSSNYCHAITNHIEFHVRITFKVGKSEVWQSRILFMWHAVYCLCCLCDAV